MDFLKLPLKTALQDRIMARLELTDLLNLRMVCKTADKYVKSYFKQKPDLLPQVKITSNANNEDGITLEDFVRMQITFSSLYFMEEPFLHLFNQQHETILSKFKDDYAPFIKHVRIDSWLITNPNHPAMAFWRSFTKIPSIEASYMLFDQPFYSSNLNSIALAMGGAFKSLKTLQVTYLSNARKWDVLQCFIDFVQYCSLTIPQFTIRSNQRENQLCRLLVAIGEIIQQQNPTTIKTIDFTSLDPKSVYNCYFFNNALEIQAFIDLCKICKLKNIKMVNVHSTMLKIENSEQNELVQEELRTLGLPLTSLICDDGPDLSHLANINVPELNTLQCNVSFGSWLHGPLPTYLFRPGPIWSNQITTLLINVFTSIPTYHSDGYMDHINATMETFFNHASFTGLKDLFLSFPETYHRLNMLRDNNGEFSYCPSLETMSLKKWPGTMDQLAIFSANMPNLQQVILIQPTSRLLTSAFFFAPSNTNLPKFVYLKLLHQYLAQYLDTTRLSVPKSPYRQLVRICSNVLTRETNLKKLITVVGLRDLLGNEGRDLVQKYPYRTFSKTTDVSSFLVHLANMTRAAFMNHNVKILVKL